MNIILEYSLQIKVPKFTTNNNELLLLCAGMNDLSLMSSTVSGARTLLSQCTTALTWAGLGFRADKSHSIVIIKGTPMSTARFSVSKATDQPQHSRQVKFLGRIIDGSFSDRNSSVELADKLLAGLRAIDESHFTGTQKLWILQHLLIPRIQWPLLIHEVPISLAFKLEQIGSVFIRKWLHLHYSTSSLYFYSSACPCPLPIKSLSSALKAAKISGHLLLINFQNLFVSSCVPKLQTGLGRLKILSCQVRATLNSVKSVKANIITGLGLDTPRLPRSQKINLQKTTENIYQTTTQQMMTTMPCPKISNCRFSVSGQDD